MKIDSNLQDKAILTIRFLSADMVQQANSGHPGLPMGAAAMAFTLWARHLRFNPRNPLWPDRDRFILSGGHGSALLYSLLYLTGFDLTLDDLKQFRQLGSNTPGHPEYGLTPGVEVTTGPLGQGFANGVGMAIASSHLGQIFNRPEYPIVDHYTFSIVTDGDLMEGVSSEAASLAGHLRLGKLVYLYDDNRISIDGSTDLAFTEDRLARFEAYNWHVQQIENGNDVDVIDQAIRIAKNDPRPSIISIHTQIGYGLPTKQNTAKAHGEPPGEEELMNAKLLAGWPLEPRFYIPADVYKFFQGAISIGERYEEEWNSRLTKYCKDYPDLANEFKRRMENKLPDKWDEGLSEFETDVKGIATRTASGKILNDLAKKIPELIGGSADLAPSNNTWINDELAFQHGTYQGRNFHFGVREHAMGAIVNGMAVHGGILPYAATFLVFSDYMRPAVRLSALSHYPCIWIYTHDSICLGEDGPTHQPVEQLASLRSIPGLVLIRPADANEAREAWKVAISRRDGPTALALTRQAVPIIDRKIFSPASELKCGAYVLADIGDQKPEIILIASGSEVALIIEAGFRLASEGVAVRLVSFPSWELFSAQDRDYQESVFPIDVKARIAVEAGVTIGWEKWVGDHGKIVGLNRFGASAPYQYLYKQFGFSADNILLTAKNLL